MRVITYEMEVLDLLVEAGVITADQQRAADQLFAARDERLREEYRRAFEEYDALPPLKKLFTKKPTWYDIFEHVSAASRSRSPQ